MYKWFKKIGQSFSLRTARALYGLTLRMYSMSRVNRLTDGWGAQTSSEDMELASSLRVARQRSRELVRDAGYAKRAKVVVQNNVVGCGIGLQANVMTTRNQPNERINDDIEEAWELWTEAKSCHTGGELHFCDLERQAMGQVFEAGEVFIRLHLDRLGESPVPLSLELIEAERIADDLTPDAMLRTAGVKLGIEQTPFGRPIAYFLRSLYPGESRFAPFQSITIDRIPAEFILHLRVIERWPQTRAIPWMHAAARKLNDMDGLTESELIAARSAACYMGFLEEPPIEGAGGYGTVQADGSREVTIEPALIKKLRPGEKFTPYTPNRPNTQLDPFMRLMLREVAAAVGSSYESLSRDYSQSNYSSSRLALLDDRDLWKELQQWFIRSFRRPLHRIWLRQAVLSRAITAIGLEEYAANPQKFEKVRFKPRGWSWVDPTKEVEAYKEAVRCGFTTVSDVIAMSGAGRDIWDVLKEREQELEWMKALGLSFETDPAAFPAKVAQAPKEEPAKQKEPKEEGKEPTEGEASTAEYSIYLGGRTNGHKEKAIF